jgi:hypothetical protein
MSDRLESDNQRQVQSAEEVVEALRALGVQVHDYEVSVGEPSEVFFDLDLTIGVGELTRPADEVGACDRDDCPRA